MVEIVKLVRGTNLEATFESGKYRWIPLGKVGFWGEHLFGHWFERVLISAMLILWLFALWFFHSPLIILFSGIGATICWIIYAFRVIEPKVKAYVPMYEPLEVTKCEKCGKIIAEPKELIRMQKKQQS